VPGLSWPAAEAGSLAVRVKGRGIADYVNLPISEALEVFERSS
jgi:hypothetical protein